MPTIGYFHTNYWAISDTTVPPVHLGRGGYPLWQASVVATSLPLGPFGAWLDYHVARIKWFWSLFTRIKRLDAERRAVLLTTLGHLEAPAYTLAQIAVRQTSKTLGFNRPEAWKELSREIKDSQGKAENTFRHLKAVRQLDETLKAQGSTATNPVLHLTTELAYTGFAWKGK